jgi:hypothetical protein
VSPTPTASTPTGLEAEGAATNRIRLKWTAGNLGEQAKFSVFRMQAGDLTEKTVTPDGFSATSFEDVPVGDPAKDLVEGTIYIYQVGAFVGSDRSERSNSSSATTLPNAPALTATRVDATKVKLTWATNSATATRFAFEFRTTPGQGEFTAVPVSSNNGMASGSELEHTVPANTAEVEYRAFAILPNAFQKGIRQPVRSLASNLSVAAAAPFSTAFTGNLTTDQPNIGGFCIVQRFPADVLSGSQVRITLRGSTAGDLTIDKVSISQAAATGDPYDAAADPILLKSNVQIPANTSVMIGPASFTPDATKPVLVAFDISAAAGQGNVRFGAAAAGIVSYARAATAEAGVQDRTAGYSAGVSNVYLIEKIEVA